MRLMRNSAFGPKCKYAAIRNDKIRMLNEEERRHCWQAMKILELYGVLENPRKGDVEEFFLIKLKDVNAFAALEAYALRAVSTDPELSSDVMDLAGRAQARADKKRPD